MRGKPHLRPVCAEVEANAPSRVHAPQGMGGQQPPPRRQTCDPGISGDGARLTTGRSKSSLILDARGQARPTALSLVVKTTLTVCSAAQPSQTHHPDRDVHEEPPNSIPGYPAAGNERGAAQQQRTRWTQMSQSPRETAPLTVLAAACRCTPSA